MKRGLLWTLLFLGTPAKEALASFPLVEAVVSGAGASAVSSVVLDPGSEYSLQCTAAASFRTCTTSSCTAVATDYQIGARPFGIIFIPQGGHEYWAFLPETAAATTCYVYKSNPRTMQIFR